jgi:hypothetical protein
MKPVKTIRRETSLIEAVCEHGCGHPVYGSVDWMHRVTGQESWDIHGCDGCCSDPEWQIATLQESVEIANRIILDHKNALQLEYARASELEDVAATLRQQRDSAWSDLAAKNLKDMDE